MSGGSVYDYMRKVSVLQTTRGVCMLCFAPTSMLVLPQILQTTSTGLMWCVYCVPGFASAFTAVHCAASDKAANAIGGSTAALHAVS